MDLNHKILLMIEEAPLRRLLSASLGAFHCRFVEPADDILQKVFDEVPHLIVIDDDFNHGQGRKLASMIKEDLVLKFIPIILMIGDNSMACQDEEAMELYFNKRHELENLVHYIRRTLEENYNELDLNPLTKLPGSRSSVLKMERAIGAKKLLAVCCVDLSDLSVFNNSYGDARGDEVIIRLSEIIRGVLKTKGSPEDFLGHLGGDNFIIVTDFNLAVKISEAIIHSFDAEIHKFYDPQDSQNGYLLQKNNEGFLTHYPFMAVSVVIVHDDGKPLEEISEIGWITSTLKKYTKTISGSCYIKYRHRPEPNGRIKVGETLEVQFPSKMKAIKITPLIHEPDKYSVFFNAILGEQKIKTAYQPIVDFGLKKVIGYEALTRSASKEFTMEPVLLFSLARESGKIKELDRLCVDVALSSAQGMEPDKKIFLNLNLETLIDPKIMKRIFAKKNAIEYQNIVIELTEQSILRSFEKVRDAFSELKEKGVSIAIDDLGGGAVSLRDVAILKPNYIKFDRSLIRQIDMNSTKQQIVLSMILFANGIHAVTTAEGVETREEYDKAQSLGITLGQGYYFAKPGKPFPKVNDFI
ncbi:MAG: hypothetical protein AUJ72_01905 [Candidatus Omnitrophica bacterium CG1_02_46_14]|nr:MAG: hypothetical protein AUJ72_01905 [Candidatus Omnitrophica bacterium CG1_02_46_14]